MADNDEQRAFPTKLVVGLGLVLLLVVFWGQNRDQVKVHYLGLESETRIWVALAISGFIGFFIGVLVARRGRD